MTEQNKNYNLFGDKVDATTTCAGKYLLNPFSIIDTRSGDYNKNEGKWLRKGIKSELGRNERCGANRNNARFGTQFKSNISIFSATLCEVLYKWFAPTGGTILDPFAGGSVRGIVANKLGYDYTGIELRKEQVESNYEQAREIFKSPANAKPQIISNPNELTPVQLIDDVYFKRDDLFEIGGAVGGKARTASQFVIKNRTVGQGITTAGSRSSPQINILAKIGKAFGIPVVVHAPEGQLSDELIAAQDSGARIIQHKEGYNSVIIARSREFAAAENYLDVPFGMECEEAVTQNRQQVQNIPPEVNRIVMPCGSGMTLAGVLWGLRDTMRDIPVVAVRVGADPEVRLDKYAPPNWRDMVTIVDVDGSDYHSAAMVTTYNGIQLDPYYEAKCIDFLQPADLLWIVGIRPTMRTPVAAPEIKMPNWIIGDSNQILDMLEGAEFDMVMSCPPYGDLEVYSDIPEDLSTMKYPAFMQVYRQIIEKSCGVLKRGGFAAFVVSEFRDKDGNYYGFVPDTIRAFTDAGCKFYNEIILVNKFGNAGMRANNCMKTSKVVRVHQNVLIFKKP